MSKASEDLLAAIHGLLGDHFKHVLENGEVIPTKGGGTVKVDVRPATLAVIAKFLKDNGIEVAPGANSNLGELAEKLTKAVKQAERDDDLLYN